MLVTAEELRQIVCDAMLAQSELRTELARLGLKLVKDTYK